MSRCFDLFVSPKSMRGGETLSKFKKKNPIDLKRKGKWRKGE